MLRYYLDKQLLPERETASPEHKPYVELLSLAEIQERKDQLDSLFDHYQMMHNEHQEEAVRFLTIATSIFMPLTLLTGWYGMNFTHMPELYWKYSYIVVIAVAILILLLELILFKKKKWL
jgi:magnesium transporter